MVLIKYVGLHKFHWTPKQHILPLNIIKHALSASTFPLHYAYAWMVTSVPCIQSSVSNVTSRTVTTTTHCYHLMPTFTHTQSTLSSFKAKASLLVFFVLLELRHRLATDTTRPNAHTATCRVGRGKYALFHSALGGLWEDLQCRKNVKPNYWVTTE